MHFPLRIAEKRYWSLALSLSSPLWLSARIPRVSPVVSRAAASSPLFLPVSCCQPSVVFGALRDTRVTFRNTIPVVDPRLSRALGLNRGELTQELYARIATFEHHRRDKSGASRRGGTFIPPREERGVANRRRRVTSTANNRSRDTTTCEIRSRPRGGEIV